MPRRERKRILCDNGVYHVFNRGNNKQRLFKEDEDFISFKRIVALYKKRFKFQLLHYCLMLNHFHMLMQIGKAESLPRIMQGISQTYAKYHQEKYGNVGYLFQGRYKGLLIEKDDYLLECGRYIERNPIRAGIVKELSDYKWSSYNYYASGRPDEIVSGDALYSAFGCTTDVAKEKRKDYKDFVAVARPYDSLVDKVMERVEY